MPYCEVGRYADGDKWEGVRLFYRRYGCGATKVLLIIGTHANLPHQTSKGEGRGMSIMFSSHGKITFLFPLPLFAEKRFGVWFGSESKDWRGRTTRGARR